MWSGTGHSMLAEIENMGYLFAIVAKKQHVLQAMYSNWKWEANGERVWCFLGMFKAMPTKKKKKKNEGG